MNTHLLLVCVLSFVALLSVALLVVLAPLGAAQRREKQARLAEVRRYRVLAARSGAPTTSVEIGDEPADPRGVAATALHLIDRIVRARGSRAKLVSQLERSGMRMRPEEWAAIQVCAVVALAAAGTFLSGSVLGAIIGAPLGWLSCSAFMKFKIARRCAAFEQQLPDSLQLVAGALRSGFALNQSVAAVAREGAEPVAGEFGRVLQEVRLGAELEDALDDLAERMKSYDMRLVVMAIRTAREIGGNLAEVLQTTVTTMRERVQLRGQVQVLSAEGRFSAKVLTGLPILMAIYLLLFKKGYLTPLYTTGIGIGMLVFGGTLLVIGSVWLHKLTKIEV